MELIVEKVMPTIRQVYEADSQQYRNISIPFTDGQRTLQLVANLERAVESNGGSIISEIEKSITLALLDNSWKVHLRAMDELKESTQAASFEQKDPLVIYKIEAYNLFEELVGDLNRKVTSFLSLGTIPIQDRSDVREGKRQRTNTRRTRTSSSADVEAARAKAAAAGAGQRAKAETFKRTEVKISRNAPCPCGSGKKYKNCHGKK